MHRVEKVIKEGEFKLHRPSDKAIYLANEEESFRTRVGLRGFVLITEASKERVEDAIFGLELENPLGLVTDTWFFGTIVAPL